MHHLKTSASRGSLRGRNSSNLARTLASSDSRPMPRIGGHGSVSGTARTSFSAQVHGHRWAWAALLALSAQPASAQSSLTLSGLLNTGVAYISNQPGGSRPTVYGSHTPSFFQLAGQEHIDGDLSAFFRYRSLLEIHNGNTFPNQVFVGLESKSLGALTLGRSYDLLADLLPYTTARHGTIMIAHPGNLDRTVGSAIGNSLKYKSPKLGGWQVGLGYGFAEEGSAPNTGRMVGALVSYESGPWQSTLVRESLNDISYAPAIQLGVPHLYGADFRKAPATRILQDQDTTAAGVSYNAERWRAALSYTHTRLSALGDKTSARTIDVGAYRYVTAQMRVGMGYAHTRLESYKWTQFQAHVNYQFSGRTNFYALGGLQVAGRGQKSVLYLQSPATGRRQAVMEIGITHAF